MEEKLYECPECKRKLKADHQPYCCGEKMEVCTMASDAEHSRPMESEEPCDDSRSG